MLMSDDNCSGVAVAPEGKKEMQARRSEVCEAHGGAGIPWRWEGASGESAKTVGHTGAVGCLRRGVIPGTQRSKLLFHSSTPPTCDHTSGLPI
jgi:hypothetical protein